MGDDPSAQANMFSSKSSRKVIVAAIRAPTITGMHGQWILTARPGLQEMITGGITVVAVALDRLRHRGRDTQ
jgi:hypothetical protein